MGNQHFSVIEVVIANSTFVPVSEGNNDTEDGYVHAETCIFHRFISLTTCVDCIGC